MTQSLKYKTVEELEAAIDKYFDKHSKPEQTPPTVAGLALSLGFESRQSIYDYKERPAFSYTIKRAITKIEEYAETQLLYGECSATGAIFWLKNHGWSDKVTVDNNVRDYSLFEEAVEKKAKKYETNSRNKKKAKK